MEKQVKTLCVFDATFEDIIKLDVKSVVLQNNQEENGQISSETSWESQKSNNMSCSYCRVDFSSITNQREHYKLDWHRFNLKQSLNGRNPISEQEFDVKNENHDISSISGSDSEKEDTLDSYASAQGKLFLINERSQVFSLYKCLLFRRKDEITNDVLNERLRTACILDRQWSIFMLGGGHFAGAVFRGKDPILHKTFHCYTVRQGQGGSQSTRDNKSGGSHPKSAGASLRRYNEQSLTQHVQDIVEQWKTEISESSLIFYRATGHNRTTLFGGPNAFLKKFDERLRTIPFSTRRATYTEVQRVFNSLSTVEIYENLESATRKLDKHRLQNRETKKNRQINRAKSRERMLRPLPTKHSSETNLPDLDINAETEYHTIQLMTSDQEICLEHLEEYRISEKPTVRNSKKKKLKKSSTQKVLKQQFEKKTEMIKVLSMGNLLRLKELIDNIGHNIEENEIDVNELKNNFMNEILDDDGNSLIHIAAMNEHSEVISFLLENNSDPCLKNKKQQTAYCCTASREVREVMKEFARKYPDKYNYNKAQIPVNTLSPEEITAKKKIQKKLKKEKERTKKIEQKNKNVEEAEKERFLNLSDREKRALAAERRILSQNGNVTSRCFLCGADMSGKVPFEYLNNRFCSIDCLKAHRVQNPILLS